MKNAKEITFLHVFVCEDERYLYIVIAKDYEVRVSLCADSRSYKCDF